MKLPLRVESGTWEYLQILFDEKIAKLTKKIVVTRVIPAWIAVIELQRLKNKPKPKPSEPFYFLIFRQTFFMKSPELSVPEMWK